jgi:hypothetical protein
MMSRRLVAANLALAVVAAALLLYIARQFMAPMPLPVGGRRAGAAAAAPPPVEAPRLPVSAYNVVAARNLFSPTRSEAPSGTLVASGPVVRPNLFGVIVGQSGAIAYLEDPSTKRISGYRIGDRIMGGTVQAIKADAVTIDAPGGAMDVRLHDPGKPRAAPATVSAAPQPAPMLPGVIPPAAPTPPAAQIPPPQIAQPPLQPGPQPGQPPTIVPTPPAAVTGPTQPSAVTPPVIPGRRPLPPNLLRRLPPGTGDASQQ